ncbi:MAG: hypothetical protein H6811_05395 [Phycisphaeraceae bacterium]|nr:hypothetical protein [Phycisphaeraceae bacterium]
MDEQGRPIPCREWTQTVIVEKLDAFDYASCGPTTRPTGDGHVQRAMWTEFPLRVTVIVSYQGSGDYPRRSRGCRRIVPW